MFWLYYFTFTNSSKSSFLPTQFRVPCLSLHCLWILFGLTGDVLCCKWNQFLWGKKKSSLPHHVTQITPRDRQGAKDGCSRLWLSIFFWELNAPGVRVGIGDSQYPLFTFPGMGLLMKSYGWTTEIIRDTVYALYYAFCEPLVSWAESQREAFKDTKYSATTAGSGDAIRDAWLYSREGTSLYWLFVNWEEGQPVILVSPTRSGGSTYWLKWAQ